MQQLDVFTERDHALLRGMGFPLAADFEIKNPSPREVADVILRVFHAPAARLVEAAAYALGKLAGDVDSHVLTLPQEEKALRRLGFVLDSLAVRYASFPKKAAQLTAWAQEVEKALPLLGDVEPLALTSVTTAGRLRRLRANASKENEKWCVYGTLDLRLGF